MILNSPIKQAQATSNEEGANQTIKKSVQNIETQKKK